MLLLAVSGGIDSMYLADSMHRRGTPFAAAHCNFGLRGRDSDEDEALVRSWCTDKGIRLHVKRFNTADYATEKGISIEMAARELRYRWFGELCREHGYEAVATAHQADDNAETLLLNLVRGTGPRGLCGMKPEGRIPDPAYADIPLLRPLLGVTREEIAEEAARLGIPFREDRTNALDDYRRNFLRNRVFPLLKELNPSVVRTLNRDIERFAAAYQDIPEAPEEEAVVPDLPPLRYTVTEERWDFLQPLKQAPGTLILDADKIHGEPIFGPWRDGDWFRPLGMRGRKKVQDWFTDHHWSLAEKHRAVLLRAPSADGRIWAIVGAAIDDDVKVGPCTRRIYRIVTDKI